MTELDALEAVPCDPIGKGCDPTISGLSYHSSQTQPGDLFFCFRGQHADGHEFAQEAVDRGAVALLVERELAVQPAVPQLMVPDCRRWGALVSAIFWGQPTKDLLLIGVTGTSGKTTTTHLIRHLLHESGLPTGMIGTLGTMVGGKMVKGMLTTPEAPDLQRVFRQMVMAGDRAAVMEVSSHGLALHRVTGCHFNIGVFTNIAHEHLDFHKTMKEYLAAKGQLFRMLGDIGLSRGVARAVINGDDPNATLIGRWSAVDPLYFGRNAKHVQIRNLHLSPARSTFTLRFFEDVEVDIEINMPALYNIYNATAAAAAAWSTGMSPSAISDGLARADQVPGRFEIISTEADDVQVIVDFAHTDDELENLMNAVVRIAPAGVLLVFGCGGERDPMKRPKMGQIAQETANYTIITSDNPRREDPRAIAKEIEAGFTDDTCYEVILDRTKAIARAIALAKPNDLVVLAGKGHETYQVLAEEVLEMDDREEGRQALKRRRKQRDD